MIRNLKAEEIEVRPGSLSGTGVTLLLYKNARVDQAILDETYGITGWQRKHEQIGGEWFCTVSIWDKEKGQWISKQDVGTQSEYEKTKGAASDAFKRACVNLGIGRELYTAPFIFVPNSKLQIGEVKGKKQVKDHFRVDTIRISETKEITELKIVNQRKETVFYFQQKREILSLEEQKRLYRELERTGVPLQAVLERYGLSKIEEMDGETLQRALQGLKRTKAA